MNKESLYVGAWGQTSQRSFPSRAFLTSPTFSCCQRRSEQQQSGDDDFFHFSGKVQDSSRARTWLKTAEQVPFIHLVQEVSFGVFGCIISWAENAVSISVSSGKHFKDIFLQDNANSDYELENKSWTKESFSNCRPFRYLNLELTSSPASSWIFFSLQPNRLTGCWNFFTRTPQIAQPKVTPFQKLLGSRHVAEGSYNQEIAFVVIFYI